MKCPDCFNGMRPALFAGPDYACTTPGCVGGYIQDTPRERFRKAAKELGDFHRRTGPTVAKALGQPHRFRAASAKARGQAIHERVEAELKKDAADPGLLSAGTYTATVDGAQFRHTANGMPFMVVSYAIDGQPDANVKQFTSMNGSHAHAVKQTMEACGVDTGKAAKSMDLVKAMEGKRVQVEVDIKGGGIGAYNSVTRVSKHDERQRAIITTNGDLENWAASKRHIVSLVINYQEARVHVVARGITEDIRTDWENDLRDMLPIGVSVSVSHHHRD